MSAHRNGDKAMQLVLSQGEHASLRKLAHDEHSTMTGIVRRLVVEASDGRNLRLSDEEFGWLKAVAKGQNVSTHAALRNLLFEAWRRVWGKAAE